MIESIVISPDIKEVKVGQTIDFSYKIFPTETEIEVTFKSDNEEVMIVKNQTLTFLSKGIAHLIIEAKDYKDFLTIVVGESNDSLADTYSDLERALYNLEIELESKLKICDLDLRKELDAYKDSIRRDAINLKASLLSEYDRIKSEYNQAVKNEFNLAIIAFKDTLAKELILYKEQVNSNSSEAFNVLEKIKQNGNLFFNDLNNRLSVRKEEFTTSLENISTQQKINFVDSVDSKLTELQGKVQEYVKQIDSSSEYAVNYIYKAMNTAIDNIESAENTVLKNIEDFKLQAIEDIKKTIEEIDATINEYISKAKQQIDDIRDKAISEIKKMEIVVKNTIELALDGALGKLETKLEELYVKLEDKEQLLEAELEEKKNELMTSFDGILDEAIFALEKVKNKLIGEFTQEVSIFFNTLVKREQEIISNIIAVVEGYDLELQNIIDAKVRYFKDQLDLILNNYWDHFRAKLEEHTEQQILRINEVRDSAISRIGTSDTAMDGSNPSVRKDAIDALETKKNQILDSMLETANEEIRKFIGSIVVQKYVSVLSAGQKIISLSEADFIMTARLKLYLDGILLIENKHYTVDIKTKTITLKRSYSDDLDVLITEDFPDNELQDLKDELLTTGTKFVEDSLNKLIEDSTKIVEESKNEIIESSKNYIDKYIKQFSEGKYYINLLPNRTKIEVPINTLKLNSTVKLYINGILQIIDMHYSLDLTNNLITLNEPFSYPVDCVLIQQLPVSTGPRRSASLTEIDSLFEHSIRIADDYEIDDLFVASDRMIDDLF